MKVIFYTGPAGSRVSEKMYEKLINDSLIDENKKLFLVVPEQSTMQTQRSIVTAHPRGGTFNIDIVSFNRLAYRVFEELGLELPSIIDDTGKNLILRKVIEDKKDEFKTIKVKNTQGFVSEIKSVISELLQYSVSFDMLENACERLEKDSSVNKRLRWKLEDILTIYKGFREYISDKFVTTEEITEILTKYVDKSQILKDSIIAFDGFTGFTPSQYSLIEKLFDKAEVMYFTANLDKENPDEMLFGMTSDMLGRIGKLADLNHVYTQEIYFKMAEDYYENTGLSHLSKNIFRAEKKFSGDKECSKPGIVHYLGLGINKEVDYVASEIRKLVSEEGLRYRDIGIILSSPDAYREPLREAFLRKDIPLFLDNKRSVITNPEVEYLRSAINVIVKDYSYEAVFRFLKCFMCDIDRAYVDLFENYCLALGIRGRSRFNKTMLRKYPGKREMSYDRINKTRQDFMELIEPLYKVFKSKKTKVSDYVEAIREFIDASKLEEKLDALSKECEESFDFSRAKEYSATYEKVDGLLEQITKLLGEEKLPVDEFMSIFDAGVNELKLGIIPPTLDMVMAGDVERTRLGNIRALFFLGMDEGLVPKNNVNTGLFSEYEREEMLAADLELSPTIRQKAFMQNFYLYLHFTKPTFRLYLSSNKENMPSKLIKNFYKMFPNMPKLEDERMEGLDLVCTRQDAIRYALEGISGIEEEEISDKHKSISAALKATMVSGTIDPVISDILCRASQKVTDEDITAYAFKLLYGDLLNISVSKVEQYAKCPFSFFAEYGLGLEERKIYEIGAADMGSIFHGALEIYSTELSKQNYDFGSVPEETREVLVKEAVDKAMCDIHESVFSDTKRNEYMRERIEKMMQKTAWALGKQYKAGSFNAKDYEKAFSVIEEGMRISGKIDRVDYATVDNQSYVKIIDYKSSQKKIDYGKIYDGLNIQLFVYLHSLLSDTVKPSAAMYYAIDDPVVDVNDEADTEKETLKKLKPTGIVNCEKPSLDALIGNETENQSLYIPASITQKGELNTRCTTAVTESQLRLISEYSYEKLISLGKEIKSGKVAASPYSDSCEYCKYSDLCPFDSEIKGNNFRQHTQIKKLENQTVVQVAMEQFSKALNKDKEVKDENGN